jgi:hypothetical protein
MPHGLATVWTLAGMRVILCHLLYQTSPEMDSGLANFRRGEALWQERESSTLAADADEVEPYS